MARPERPRRAPERPKTTRAQPGRAKPAGAKARTKPARTKPTTSATRLAELRALRRRVRALDREIEARDEFLATVAHELRNPIAPVYLQAQMLLATAKEAGKAAIPAVTLVPQFQGFRQQIEKFLATLERLADVSRISAGNIERQLVDLELGAVVRDVAAELGRELTLSGSRLELRAPRPVDGRWDRLHVEQIVRNLLSNAIRYGLGTPITVSVAARGARATLTVRDRGVGIALADQARIFERFERTADGRRAGGLGVGLWIVRRLCAAAGGTVSVTSRPGKGATFTVMLPRRADET